MNQSDIKFCIYEISTQNYTHIVLCLLLFFFYVYSASIRRSSMRGEKSQLFMKEAKEEAMHFGWGKTDLELNVCFFKEKH